MSAYIVHPDTIDYILTCAGRFVPGYESPFTFYIPATDDTARLRAAGVIPRDCDRLIGHCDQQEMYAILMAENVRSVNTKYRSSDAAERDTFRRVDGKIDPIVALKSVACLRYQSCEHPDYTDSVGAHLLDAIELRLIHALPGYDAAPWGWTRAEAARVVAERLAAQLAATPPPAADVTITEDQFMERANAAARRLGH